jgi:rod shape-determining protein MreC
MDRTPPPFFKQGPSANARLLFFALLAITFLIVDAKINAGNALRQGVATILFPVQRALLFPRDWISGGAGYFQDVVTLTNDNSKLKREAVANASTLQRVEQLDAENRELRRLIGLRDRLAVNSLMAQVLYEARDPFIRRLVLDKGSQDGVLAGQPVIDSDGVIGQITRVFPISSEVTVINDQALTVPVQISRSGVRAIAYGGGPQGMLELRYLAANADVKIGDLVTTSGLDGLYPAGLPVGKIAGVDSRKTGNFLPATVEPLGGLKRSQALAIVMVDKSRLPPPPAPADDLPGSRKRRAGKE